MDYKEYLAGKSFNNFWSLGKEDLLFRLLKKISKKNLRILNLGAGTGEDLKIQNKFGKVYVIDLNKKVLDLISKDSCFEKIVGDARKLPYKNDFFDVVIALDIFEHIGEDYLAVKEVHRVLKKSGFLIFSVPAFPMLYGSHDIAAEHKRRYSMKNIKFLLRNFKNLRIYYWNFTLFLPVSIFRLLRKKTKPKIDILNPPVILNQFLFKLLKIENYLISNGHHLPFGVSIVGICKK